MQLRYNFRLYPMPGQQAALARAFGCARTVLNDGLRLRQEAHDAGLPYIRDTDLQKQVITAAKKTPQRQWLGEVSSVVLVQALADLHTAYRNFFASATGKRKGRAVAPPRYRSRKDSRQTIRLTRNGFSLRPNGRLYVAKIGDVPVRWSRDLPSEPSSVTVIRDACGRYYASFVADTRRDHAHQLSTRIIRDNQAVYVEDLCVVGLARTRLAKSVHDAGWAQFTRMLEYKAARHGRHFARISRFEPTSQVCSACGTSNGPKPLHVRTWTCPHCATTHDRDLNAARNILAAGRADRLNACGAQIRPEPVPAPRSEAGTHPSAA